MDLLFWGDVLVDQHAHVGIVKLPVLSALRIKAWIGACDTALDIPLGVGTAEEDVHGLCPACPVLQLLVQGFVDLRDCREICDFEALYGRQDRSRNWSWRR